MQTKPLEKLPAFFPMTAIFLLVITAYFPALTSGFIWDDDKYVVENATLRDAGGLKEIWLRPEATPQYYPLVHTVLWLEYHLWGLKPFGYHLVNILLHALNAVLALIILRKLSVPGAWLAAAVFALHPVQAESVAWVTELKNLLSGMFYLSALLAYLHFDDPAGGDKSGKFSLYLLALFLFICALLSKTVTATLPAVIVLVLWWKRPSLATRQILPLIPLLAVGAGLGLMTAWMEKHHVLATGDDWSLSFLGRLLVAGKALWFYLGKLVWPHRLTFIYPRWNMDAPNLWQYLYPASFLAGVTVLFVLRDRIGKGPLVALGCFAASLAPALGFFDVYPFRYSYVADHFQYLASLGAIAGVTEVSAWLLNRLPRHQRTAAAVFLLAALWVLTFKQAGIYRDIETLWQDTIAKNPACWMAHNNLGNHYLSQGDLARAEEHFRQAVAIDPGAVDQLNNLGLVKLARGAVSEALADLKRAVKVAPDNHKAHYNLGLTYLQMDSLARAEAELRQAVMLQGAFAESRANLGVVFLRQNRLALAEMELRKALELRPDLHPARYNLGLAYQYQKDNLSAEREFLAALRIRPDFPEAEYSLGAVYLETGRKAEAEAVFGALLQRYPRADAVREQLEKLKKQR